MSANAEREARPLGWTSAASLVVASMIGAGIFSTSGYLAQSLGRGSTLLWAWAVGGFLALAGALSYGELGALMPRAGGEYVYLTRIFGPTIGFLCGFVSLVAGFAAPIAGIALVLGKHMHELWPALSVPLVAALAIALLTGVHAFGVRAGARVNDLATAAKLAFLVAFVALGLAAPPTRAASEPLAAAPGLASGPFAQALVLVAFAYTGWNAAAYVAGEIRDAQRKLPSALVVGTALVSVLYLLVNVVFLRAASPAELAGVVDVGALAARRLFGERLGSLFTQGIVLVLLSTVSAFVMSGPRVTLAMARDGALPRVLGTLNRRGSPVYAVLLQGALALAMLLATERPDAILTYVGLLLTVSTGLAVLGLLVLRRREPDLPRPYRVPLYPWTPLVFVLLSAWMVSFALLEAGGLRAGVVSALTLAVGLVLRPLVRSRARPLDDAADAR